MKTIKKYLLNTTFANGHKAEQFAFGRKDLEICIGQILADKTTLSFTVTKMDYATKRDIETYQL